LFKFVIKTQQIRLSSNVSVSQYTISLLEREGGRAAAGRDHADDDDNALGDQRKDLSPDLLGARVPILMRKTKKPF